MHHCEHPFGRIIVAERLAGRGYFVATLPLSPSLYPFGVHSVWEYHCWTSIVMPVGQCIVCCPFTVCRRARVKNNFAFCNIPGRERERERERENNSLGMYAVNSNSNMSSPYEPLVTVFK